MRPLDLGLHAAFLLLGATVGLLAVVVHRSDLAGVPLGLVIAPVATLVVAWSLWGSRSRRRAVYYAVGWLIVFGVLVAGRPEGDFAVAGDLTGYVLIGTALVLVVVAVASLVARGSDQDGMR